MYSAAIYTLGCKLNQLESEALAGAFRAEGFSLIPWDEGGAASADIFIINTCTVTSRADQKARRVIRKALRDNERSCVIVTGCYAHLEPGALEELGAESGGRLFVLKNEGAGRGAGAVKSALLDLPRYLRAASLEVPVEAASLIGKWIENQKAAEVREGAFRFTPEYFSFHTRGLLKIQDGCDNRCTYCRVRLARGKSVSLAPEAALAELRALEAKGYAEASLTGVNITQYRMTDNGGLGELLLYLLEGTDHIALRLSSLEPEGVDERFTAALASPRIRPHFHLSVQSGSAPVLEKMGRNYRAETVEQAAALLRSVKDNPFLACDIITGFPGETEAEFEKTLGLCQKLAFAWIHAFPYSKRPGTPAAAFPQTVSERIAGRRVETLMELAALGRRNYTRSWTGRETTVLIEGGPEPKAGYCHGTSENYLKLLVRYAGYGRAACDRAACGAPSPPPPPQQPPPGTVLRCRIGDCLDGEFDAAAEEA
jgi:threonylcarbamoyladenosine tRNA methylthiotransferase MtaB